MKSIQHNALLLYDKPKLKSNLVEKENKISAPNFNEIKMNDCYRCFKGLVLLCATSNNLYS